jgi:sialic acid synthase SpsE
VARKSLCATAHIRAGEPFSEHNIGSKRPGSGISPMRYWSLLGQQSPRDYAPDELLENS